MRRVKKVFLIPLTAFGLALSGCDFLSNPIFGSPNSEEKKEENNNNNTISVSSVSFNEHTKELKIGEKYTLEYEVSPSNASNKDVTFTSSSPSIATVNSDGLVSALQAGTATISVTTIDGNKKDECVISVIDSTVSVTGVELNYDNIEITLGSTFTLLATISPSDADNKTVSWSSSASNIVSVDENGKLTALELGEATISVTTEDGEFSDSCKVTVKEEHIAVTGVSINFEQVEIYEGDSYTLNAILEPYNASEQGVVWSSDNESAVSVENGTITALAVGSANIKVTTVDSGFIATCIVTVLEKENDIPYVPGEGGDIYRITAAGEYNVANNYKQIYVNAPDAEVIVNLNGVTIENKENSPIYVEECDSIEISAKKNTTNYIKDLRSAYTEDVDGQGKGAIYVNNGDLKLKGTGTLDITANYFNGIHGKDDVKIQKQNLNITAINHAIKGNDSVTVTSGTLNLSCGGDGIKTENSDISSKGNQRGTITINGGSLTINSWGDALSASYNVVIEELDSSTPISLNIKTNKYSTYSGDLIETSASNFYLKMSSSTYSNGSYTYAAYINNNWYKASYVGSITTSSQQGGGPGGGGPGGGGFSNTYYVYSIEKPSEATSFKLYRFSGSNVTSFSTSSYNAVSDQKAFNSEYDMINISVRSGKITFNSWENYAGTGASAKGIKAENEIYIVSGAVDINAYDDAIHANNDGALENGSLPLGNVNISGGTITLASADDGIHADYILTISGGTINVTTSYEGLEANLIRVNGGETTVYASDDGVNAKSGKASPNISVTGGLLDVTVPTSGDTDGIDSNGTFTQTGGTVIVKGPGSASGMMGGGAAALDTDGTVTISSGSLIIFGGSEQTPKYTGTTKTICSSSTVSAGSHTVSFTSESYTTYLKYSTNGCVVYSSLGSATLK